MEWERWLHQYRKLAPQQQPQGLQNQSYTSACLRHQRLLTTLLQLLHLTAAGSKATLQIISHLLTHAE